MAGGRWHGDRCVIPKPSRASYTLLFCSRVIDQSKSHDVSTFQVGGEGQSEHEPGGELDCS